MANLFTEGEFIKDCVMRMAENICPEKKQEFANVCLARSTVAQRIEDVSSDIKRQLECRGMDLDFFCQSHLIPLNYWFFWEELTMTWTLAEELFDIKSPTGQTRGTDLFACVCSAVDDIKLPWRKVSGIITDAVPSMAGEWSGLSVLICNKVSEEGGDAKHSTV